MDSPVHTWLVPRRLAIAERPGGGGRSHRISRRSAELEWWEAQGVRTIVSTHPARTGLLDAALAGFAVRWYPMRDEAGAPEALDRLARGVADLLASDEAGAVLVHCDRSGEWLTAAGAVLSVWLGCSDGTRDALADMRQAGLVVGSTAIGLVSAWEDEFGVPPAPARPMTPSSA